MKLSDIKGERTLDVIAELIVPVMNIASDKEASAIFKRAPLPEGEAEKKAALANRIKSSLPALLKGHKDDVITILAALAGKSKKKYAENLTLGTLTQDFIELLNDEAFYRLF